MEFSLFKTEQRTSRYLIGLIIPAFIMGIFLVLLFVAPPEERDKDMMIILAFFAGVSLFMLLIIYAAIWMSFGTKKHRLMVDETGITFLSPKKRILMNWEDIGIVRIYGNNQVWFVQFFHKSLSEEQCRQFITKGTTVNRMCEKFIFIQYYKEFYEEFRKYYDGAVINEYTLAIAGEL